MNIAKKRINKVCAILIIIALTISDFFVVGSSIVSYAVDTIKTNNSNVDFSAYFIGEDGEKLDEIGVNIDEGEVYLYVDVSVYNEGYFNGTITINSSNFKLKEDILSTGISEISGNTVTLKQINAGSTETIQLAIEPIVEDTITREGLVSETEVVLSGEYVNSKNVEKDKYIEISGTATVTLTWGSSEETEAELNAELLTNSIYEVEEQEKRIVQLLVNSNITDNNYPIYSSSIKVTVPENVQEISVSARSTDSTNSNIEFGTENYVYNEEEQTVEILIQNSDTENISWNKECYDTFVITYVFDINEYITDESINVSSTIITYDSKELTNTQDVHIEETENIDGVISYTVSSEEESIYKGKLYTGEEREYTVTNEINVNYLNIVDSIILNCNESTYIAGEQEGTANIVYSETKINKEEFIKIFGEDGSLTIKDENGIVVATINKNSDTDEEGNIVVNYEDGTKTIEIDATEPKAMGTLKIEHTKTILSTGYSRETIDSLTEIKETVTGTDNGETVEEETTIELKNTSSEASLEVSTEKLSSTEMNEDVKITAILLNNDESKDLYQNPVVKITLPEQVTSVNGKCKVLYGNGLELQSAEVKKENGKYTFEISLSGTQEKYNTEALEGTTIIIYANIEIDPLATDSNEEITLTYTNELATEYKDNGTQTKEIGITSSQGVITANSIEEYNVKAIGDEEEIVLDINSTEQNATVNIDVVNNEGTEINNITILGSFPTGEDSNLGASLLSGITLLSEKDGVGVYYSDESNPTNDITDSSNGWSFTGDASTAQSYLIVIDSMEAGETFSANYTINIPANLTYNLEAEEGYTVSYTNILTATEKSSETTAVTLTTGTGAELETAIKAYVGGEEVSDGDTLYTGEIVTYEVTFKNNGTEEATNVEVEAIIPEGTTAVEYVENISESEAEEVKDSYNEIEVSGNTLTKTYESVKSGSSKTYTYEVRIDEEAANNSISAYAEISYNATTNNTDTTEITTNKITNNITLADVKMELTMMSRTEDDIIVGNEYVYNLNIENTSDNTLSNVKIEFQSNSVLLIQELYSNYELCEMNNGEFTISSLAAGETVDYQVTVLIQEAGTATLKAIANNTYFSNVVTQTVDEADIAVSMTSENEGEIINNGDTITYKITVKNSGEKTISKISVIQKLSVYLNVKKVTINEEEVEYSTVYGTDEKEGETEEEVTVSDEILEEDTEENTEDTENIEETVEETEEDDTEETLEESDQYTINIEYENELNNSETLTILIEAESDSEFVHKNNIYMASVAEVYAEEQVQESEQINHVLVANANTSVTEENESEENESETEDVVEEEEEEEEETNDEIISEVVADTSSKNTNNTENEEQEQNSEESTSNTEEEKDGNTNTNENSVDTTEETTYVISGTAWLDVDEDGQRESGETTLSNIGVTLLNLGDSSMATTTTTDSGFYSFTNIVNGDYVVIFDIDTEVYALTTYRADGVQESRNSDVENVNITINEVSQYVFATDTITINGNSSTNIDIGLIEAKVFDLALTKTITKITVTNTAGTETTEYNDASLAKVEIKSRYLSGSTIIIEYKIQVTNEGELAGYANNIVDYIPSDLTFNSSLNSDWYQSGEYLYSNALTNEKIEPGETKELTLILTKTMTETNTGLVNNMSEISEDYNSRGISDTDSTPGNKVTSEDDLGQANAIISVSTGTAVSYVSITFIIVAVIAVGAFILTRKILKVDAKYWTERRK